MCFLVELIFAPGAVVCLVLFFRVAVSCRSGLVRLWLACAVCPVCWLMSAVACVLRAFVAGLPFVCVWRWGACLLACCCCTACLHTSKWKLSTQ